LAAGSGASLGAGAEDSFADRFNAGIAEAWRDRQALALVDPELSKAIEPQRTIERISPNSATDIFYPYRLATRPKAASAATPSVSADTMPMDYALPDVSKLVVPAAALSLMTWPAIELSRHELSPASPTGVSAGALAGPAPPTSPLKLPGPFHVFFATGPAGDATVDRAGGNGAADNNAGGNGNGAGNGLAGSNAGGNGNGKALGLARR